ncbi:MAG: transposase [Bacteroidales bacterium]|nr:transposase [Bacteroidales bacterium]
MINNRTFFGDKKYHDHDFFERLYLTQNAVMMTPVKAIKGQSEWGKQYDRAANDLLSKAVSNVRQPIEGWFNWLIEKTDFQRANNVRSAKGLLIHEFGKLAATFIYLIFNP